MKNFILFIALLTLLMTSCQKDKYGNTAIYSNQYEVTWTFQDPSYYTTLNIPQITQDVLDNGAVMAYLSNGNGGWVALPCTVPMNASYASTYTPVFNLGGVTIWKLDTDFLTLDPGYVTFKIVVLTQKQLIAHPNLDLTDYESVATELAL
jgi:hypothetical protein